MNRRLNSDQITILNLLYQFRFGTTTLFTQYLKPNNRQSLNSRLDILTQQQYIGKVYEKGFKLLGKPAVYYLLPKAFTELKKQSNISARAIKNMYKDKVASQRFINHCMAIFAINNKLSGLYGNRLEFFTKNELIDYEHFPQPLPDAFFSLKTSNQPRARSRLFFLEFIDDSAPFFANVRRLKNYYNYAESGEWDVTGKTLPIVLAVCSQEVLQKRMNKRFSKGFDDADASVRVYSTLLSQLLAISSEEDGLWRPLSNSTAQLSLDEIS